VPSLVGQVIRIQLAERPDEPGTDPTWITVWLGYCDYSEDVGWPGAEVPAGERIFHCSELWSRANRWPMDRHGYTVVDGAGNTKLFASVYGHPGFNIGKRWDGDSAQNRSADQYTINGANVYYHAEVGSGSTWTDAQAIEHAMAATRGTQDPLFTVTDASSLLTSANPWEIKRGETALDFLARVCARERGKGSTYLSWSEASATGAVTIGITTTPQLYASRTYTVPSGGVGTILGALASSTTMDVDLIGDHRQVAEAFQVSTPDQWRYHLVETLGEQIQVMLTASYFDTYDSANGRSLSLERRWTGANQATFLALTNKYSRLQEAYKAIYQLHSLPRGWDCIIGDANNSNSHRIDYRCSDAGAITVPATGDTKDTDPSLIELMDDLPYFTGEHQRRGILLMYRVASAKYVWAHEGPLPANERVDKDGLWVTVPRDESTGLRYISDTTEDSYRAGVDLNQLCVTLGIRLPQRVRLATYATGFDSGTAQRRATLYQENAHLWLASPYAIYDLDTTAGTWTTGHSPVRSIGSGTTPATLRDDRDALARMHALACSWYLEDRRTARWAVRACGLFPTYEQRDGSAVDYPTLGKVIHNLSANGQTVEVNTPVVSIVYSHEDGTTTFETGWSSLDRTA
jgi:hypothetical protein